MVSGTVIPSLLLFLETPAQQAANRVFRTCLRQPDDRAYTLETIETEAAFYRRIMQYDGDIIVINFWQSEAKTRSIIENIHHLTPDTPLLVLVDDDRISPRLIECGAYDCIVRPGLEASGLRRILAHALARGRLEKNTTRKNRMYQNLFDHAVDGVVLVNEQGIIHEWNPAMEALTGIPRDEAAGSFIWDTQYRLMLPARQSEATRQEIKTLTQAVMRHGYPTAPGKLNEAWIQRPDGELRFIQTALFSIPGEAGYQTAAIHRDITAQKAASDRLRILTTAVEQSPVSIVITDTAGNIEYVNAEFTRLTGYTAAEVTGKNPRVLQSGLTPPEQYNELWETLVSGQEWRGEFTNRKKNGELYQENALISPVKDDEGKTIRYLAVKQNITEHKRHEAQLRYHAALIENISAVIVSTDHQGRIVSWNPSAEMLYGWHADEVIGRSLLELLQPASPYATEAEVTQQLNESGHWQGDVIATARGGRQVYVLASIARLYDENGSPAGAVEIHRDIEDRIRAEEVLREAERFASSIVDALTQHIAILDETGTILAVNEAWRTFARDNGADVQRVCEGANYLDVLQIDGLSPDAVEAEQVKNGLLAVMRGEKNAFSMEYSCHSLNERRWYNVTVTRFRDDGPMRVVVSHDSITRRILVEEQLHQANNFLLMLNRIITMTIASVDVREVLEIACRELAAAFSSPQVAAALMNTSRTDLNVIAEYRSPNRPSALGSAIPLYNNPSVDYLRNYKIPLVSSRVGDDPAFAPVNALMAERGVVSILLIPLFINDELAGSIGVDFTREHEFTDEEIILAASVAQTISKPLENSILHQRLTENMTHLEAIVSNRTEQLSRLNQRMAAILNNASDAIILAASDNTIENANLAFERQFGYQTDGAFGKSVFTIAEPGFRDRMVEAVRIARETGIDQRVELHALRQDGTGFDADVAIARVENNESHVVCSIRDITRLKEVERIKDRFISMVSHELRTPTTSLVLSSNTLKTHYERMTEVQRHTVIERMQRQSQVLAELIEGILDLSRIEVRTGVERTSPVEMDKVIKLLAGEFLPALTGKSLRLETLVDSETDMMYGEEIDLERIWRNLIGNAVKYTPEGGAITVRYGQIEVVEGVPGAVSSTLRADLLPWQDWNGRYLVGQVEDTGHGIPPQDLQQLFTRFYRGWAAASNVPGTGLGLSLVREVLRLYNGEIHIVSQLNTGSTFSFWIPIDEE